MVLSVEVAEVDGRGEFRRFVELPFALYRDDHRWAPPVMSYERARVDGRRNPALPDDVRYLLARRMGRVVGRLLECGDGRFGCFDCDDAETGAALLGAADRARTGPLPFADEQEGVLVRGHDVEGATGRQWHPPWYREALEASGFIVVAERPSWRLAAGDGMGRAGAELSLRAGGDRPVVAGPYVDRRLVFEEIAAVPDLAAALRGSRPRGAWRLARQARTGGWEGCVVVRLAGDRDPAAVVPPLVAAAAAAGYRWVIAPWAPDHREPETVHALFQRR